MEGRQKGLLQRGRIRTTAVLIILVLIVGAAGWIRGQAPAVQRILSEYGHLVCGRMGLPHLENDTLSVITLIVRADTDELGALTGKLGRISGVSVKSALSK